MERKCFEYNVHVQIYTHARAHAQMFNESFFLFQDEFQDGTKGSKREDKKKTIFISPFMRYKCVIPMIMDQETKEREKQQEKRETEKEEEKEGGPSVKIEDEYVNEAEINESKNRVLEHFKQVSQTNKQVAILPKKKKKKKSKQLILNQIRGGKKKRKLDIGNENQKKKGNNDFSTVPTPYLDAGPMSKKAKQEAREAIEKREMQESLAQVQSNNNSETAKSIR